MFLYELEDKIKNKSLNQLYKLLNTRELRLNTLYNKRLDISKNRWWSAWSLNKKIWHISFDINKVKDEIDLINKYKKLL